MKNLTKEWIAKAEADYRVATRIHRFSPPVHDMVCFHSQQVAEKYLKALLEELGLVVPRTHDLEQLRTLLHAHHPSLRSLSRGLVFLTQFAVTIRYPGDKATKRQAVSALRWAGKVRAACRALLGLRPPRPRRRKTP